MAEKTLKTKIALLYKSYAEWELKRSYVPLKGEVCFCEVPQGTGAVAAEPAVLFKVGDGVKTFENLPWGSALAADIYAWAKKANLDFGDLDANFLAKLDERIAAKSENVEYQLVDVGNGVYKLQKREIGAQAWTDVSSIDVGAFVNPLLAKKPNIVEEGTNGIARLFNEKDGGGAKFEHKDGSEAFVGVNDGGKDGMMAQIYADIKENGQWVGSRINVFHDGIYYVSKAAQIAGAAKDDADREIATLADIKALGKVLRFRGVFNSLDEVTDPQAGDVAIVGNKEYVYVVNGSEAGWREFGDVTEYATKAELEAAVAELRAEIVAEADRAKVAEEALDDKIDALDKSLAAIAKTGNVNDLIQTAGDILILNCND